MKFIEKVKNLGKRAKLCITAVVATMSMAVLTCAASAAETGETATSAVNTETVLADAGTQISTSFNSLVSTMIPVILGILGSGLVIFGIFALVKLAKKIFGKVAG